MFTRIIVDFLCHGAAAHLGVSVAATGVVVGGVAGILKGSKNIYRFHIPVKRPLVVAGESQRP